MPINFLATVAKEGTQVIPKYEQLKRYGPYVVGALATKFYFSGSSNTWERNMHGRVVIVTGGTSGLGATVVRRLAKEGAQVILLVRKLDDGWLSEHISSLREETNNPLIYAEEADLADFQSVRKFATKWIDNLPPRRLDMVVCCAAVALPPSVERQASKDGLELQMQTNYLAHFHLLTLLSPAIRSQPPDRDVRIILTSCVAGVMGKIDMNDLGFQHQQYPKYKPYKVLGTSKLALSLFAYELQRQFTEYQRQDGAPSNVHVAVVDPGMMRSPSFRRFVTFGSLWGLLLYLIMWPIWWIFCKSSLEGAQSLFFAMMLPDVQYMTDVAYISDCRVRQKPPRKEFEDKEFQQELFKQTEKLITDTERFSAKKRK
ncbi:hypothetical protein B9G98_04398 [Wickerhamiella sorbophila]|uniref:Oxidoreductase C19A8.06 n=1 Tax=Wickerhamiella sorbophila TaxID=45607 RepID=A0A2T0FP73_9ASCO|nr:hypothetical protein B9G98_04398 [Wickerhamiella sorbophila]PRT56778.1 hypothetical protein B9G98_04398 [Wickerhamiella sorbophila]